MKKQIISILFITFCLVLIPGCNSKRHSDAVGLKIRQVENNLACWLQTGTDDTWSMDSSMKKYRVNGVSIAVIHNYKIEWAKGYGFADVAEKRPVTTATLFQAASISKSLNATAVLKLVQEKKLDLNADINQYLSSWKFPYDSKYGDKKITLTNLLSHTAGLTVHGFPGYAVGDSLPDLQQVLDGLKPANTEAVRSNDEPGKNYNYSGGGTTISQLLIMDITGQPYDLFMKKYILDPLGMKSSSYTQPPDKSKAPLLATGYKADGREVAGKYHIYPEQAAAGLWTTPTDLCKFLIETQLSFSGKSSLVLTQEMTKLRLTPVKEDAGLGLFINSRVTGSYKYFNHNGGNEGFSCTEIGCRDAGEGVVIMINSDNGTILTEIANSVAKVYNWKDYYLPEKMEVIYPPANLLEKYSGAYDLRGERITFKMEGKEFKIHYNDAVWKVYFKTDSDFAVRELQGFARFNLANGRVKGLTAGNNFAPKID